MKIVNAKIVEQNLIIQPSVIGVSESVGVYALKIVYDAEWDEVDAKIITFSAPGGASLAIQDNGEEDGVVIPWEVLQFPGKVSVGVIGYAGTEQKITTTGLYDRNTFVVLPEAFGLQSAITPTPDIYQKLVQTINQVNLSLAETNKNIGDLNDLATEEKRNIVAAINEVLSETSSKAVKTVNNIAPDNDGNVELIPSAIGAASTQTTDALQVSLNNEAAAREQSDEALQSSVNIISEKIPAQASASNQLADKDFVNSSIATNTANFVGTFDTLEELEAVQNPTNNDYGFVVGTDQSGGTVYNRYKYNGSAWVFEYELNNSSFTAEQWAAIQSGITATAVEKLSGIEAGAETNTIDSISVNGVAQTPDENKNVNLTIPEGAFVLQADNYYMTEDEFETLKKLTASQNLSERGPVFVQYSTAIGLLAAPYYPAIDWTQDTVQCESVMFISTGDVSAPRAKLQSAIIRISTVLRLVSFVWRTSSSLALEGDSSLATSTNSSGWVKKSAIKEALDTKQNALTFDTTPTQGSTNPVTSGGVFEALAGGGGGDSGVKVLTVDDYNYPEGNPDRVALWLVEPGLYRVADNSVRVQIAVYMNLRPGEVAIVSDFIGYYRGVAVIFYNPLTEQGRALGACYRVETNGTGFSLGPLCREVANDLTTNSEQKVLSAQQGKVLNGRIGELSNLETTTKDSLVSAINELAARVAALEGA